jgi:DUF4097 and DUF4098 domain-containing protein YvlB
MRRSSLLLGIALLASALPVAPVLAQQKVLRGARTTPTVSVRLFAGVGAVEVIGWDRDSVEMSGVVPAGARVDGGAFSSRSGPTPGMKLFVESRSEQESREGRLVLRVPRGARVWVKTGSATVEVSGVSGGLDVNVVGGSIRVQGNPRELRAESMDGDVTVDGAPEWSRVKTATGNIVVRGGQNIGASTISGSIDASGGETERAKFESTTGTIRFALTMARTASVELETHSGAIDVVLARKGDVELDAATITGTIENRWTGTRTVSGREGRGMTLLTASGMGGSRVVARSFKGRIVVRTP